VLFLVRSIVLISVFSVLTTIASADDTLSTAEVMEALEESDWRQPDPANLLYVQLASGTVIIELAPNFAPQSIANIKTLAEEKYFDGLAIMRSQDNYVVQWGDPYEEEDSAKPLGSARKTVTAEFERSLGGIEIIKINSRDAYADIVGFSAGFPVASNGTNAWLAHCYGMVGVSRGNESDSGNGASLYVVTGHAPRHLDRNVSLVGRVISGMELLTVLPHGTGALGFYESIDETVALISIRLGKNTAKAGRTNIEIMRTDTEAFADYIVSRTYRNEEWFVEPTGRIELCNINPPLRIAKAPSKTVQRSTIRSSTRRFAARPAAVALSVTGTVSP
jgi:peptidylprolyl isomerase